MSNECPSARTPDGIALDRLFEVFSEGRRRQALRTLAGTSSPVTLEELAEAVVAAENGFETRTEDVVASFHHNHLPKLAEFGLISYDAVDGRIEYVATPRMDEVVVALLDVDARFG